MLCSQINIRCTFKAKSILIYMPKSHTDPPIDEDTLKTFWVYPDGTVFIEKIRLPLDPNNECPLTKELMKWKE